MRIGDQFFFGRATGAKQSKMAFLFLVVAIFHINLAIQPASASMSEIKPRAPGVQCRLSEAPLHCDNYSLLEAPTLNPFLAAERLDQICPVASKVLDCVDTLTPGCEVHPRLAHFEMQTALLTLICGSGRRDFLRASKCYSLQEVKDGIEKCSATLLREMEENNPCGLTRAIADCAHVEMRKYMECSFTDVELMGQMLEIYYKPTGDLWCRRSKGEVACTKRICKNGGVCRGDYVTAENPCDCSFTGWTGLRCDEPAADSPTKTCADIYTCMTDYGQIMASQDTADISALCDNMSSASKCLEDALADCRRTGSLSEKYIRQAEDQMAVAFAGVKQMCPYIQSSPPGQQATTAATAVSDRREPKWSCSDIMQCLPDSALLHDAQSRQDYVSLCKMVHRSSHCMEESLADCRRTGAIPEEQIKIMEQQLTTGIMQMKQHCPDLALPSSEPPLVTTSDDIAGPVWSCSDIMQCQPDVKRLQDAQTQQDYVSLCKMVHRSSHCMEESLQDCRRTGAIPEEQIKIMEQQLTAGIMQMKQHCPDAESSITESPSVTEPKGLTTSSPGRRTCQEIDQCQNLEQVMAAQASQDSEALCKLLNDSLQCVTEALADCRQTGMLSEEQIDVIESAINTEKLNKMCPDLGLGQTATTPEVPTETGQVSTTAATIKHIEEEESFSLIPGMNASSLVNPFLAWLKSGSKLNKAQEKLAVEQKLVAKLMRKKLKLDISLLKKKLKAKNN